MRMTVCLMLKAPKPGTVKTRLGKEIGMDEACLIYQKLAEHQINQIPIWCHLEIQYSPADALNPMKAWLGDGPSYVAQSEGSLGDRLRLAAEGAFQKGARAVLFLGGDCPDVTAELIEESAAQLDHCDVVVGPAEDGGYYLIAMKKFQPRLFDKIDWSTDQVLAQTQARIRELGLAYSLLPPHADVDDLASLQRARKSHDFLR